MEFIAFKAADEYMGIEAQYVHYLVDDNPVVPVPLVPSCYVGLMHYRGELFDVVDIGDLLGDRKSAFEGNSPIILLKWHKRRLALITDEMVGIIGIDDGDAAQPTVPLDDASVRIISPEEIWNALEKLPYGSDQIPENLRTGVNEVS